MCEAMEQHMIRCDNHREDLVFDGRLMASQDNRWVNGRDQTRYSNLSLYVTDSGKYVYHYEYITLWQGESSTSNVQIYDTLAEFKEAFLADGREMISDFEKDFLAEAGIPLIKRI